MSGGPWLHRVVDRRGALGLLGAIGAVAIAGCSGSDDTSSPSTSASRPGRPSTADDAAPVECVLTPEETEGPFVLDLSDEPELMRRDITEGRPGVPLALTLTVLGVGRSCRPLANARVDVWHTDHLGVYSGFDQADVDTEGETFMRGIQTTDANGVVTFDTVYPGWYEGRATHIHYQIFRDDGLVATSQLAFPDDVTRTVYDSRLYRDRGQNESVPTTADDALFADGTGGELLALAGRLDQGYRGTLTVGVRT